VLERDISQMPSPRGDLIWRCS